MIFQPGECHTVPSHYLNQCWPSSITQYDVTGCQWGNSPCLISGYAPWKRSLTFLETHICVTNTSKSLIGPIRDRDNSGRRRWFNSLRPSDACMRQKTYHYWFKQWRIVWSAINAGILLIGPLGTNVSEILIKIHTFPFKKMHLKMSSGQWRQFCLNVLSKWVLLNYHV